MRAYDFHYTYLNVAGGVEPVPVKIPHSSSDAAGVLGIMAAGGVACALDPHLAPAETRARLASADIGWVLAGQRLAVLAPGADAPVPPGTKGEICVAGPSIMKGYVPPEAAVDGPSLRTGDLGEINADGYLTVTGSLKEIIIRGDALPEIGIGKVDRKALRQLAEKT